MAGYFLRQPDVAVANGAFALTLRPGDMWTLSTRAMARGAPPPPPPAVLFPAAAYADDFDGCPPDQEAPYWTDMSGSWECVASPDPGRGVVMRQVVPVKPVTWQQETRPYSVFAATANLTDADVTLDVNLPAAGDAALLGARANPNKSLLDEDAMPGLWWRFDTSGAFAVWTSIAGTTVLASGTLPAAPAPGSWHTFRLVVAAGVAAGYIDGAQAFAGLRVQGRVPAAGFPGMGVGSWGQHVLFDKFVLKASTA